MKPIIIIPDNDKKLDIKYPIQGRLSYTYLHGKLEEDCGYDCYNIANPQDHGFDIIDDRIVKDEKKSGIYPAIYNKWDCTLFLWFRGIEGHYGGLVVYNDDLESYQYAKECFEIKKELI